MTDNDNEDAETGSRGPVAELAAEIRRLRTAAGLSQNQLAAQIGYTRQYVSLAERASGNLPSQEHLLTLREQARTN